MDGWTEYAAPRGLSPPTRGNLDPAGGKGDVGRSIPAHAGEPPRFHSDGEARGVYPRPRGGTRSCVHIDSGQLGLSPPTRGNPLIPRAVGTGTRSIPAHAGEPDKRKAGNPIREVYPRPRGGTGVDACVGGSQGGLSPPTRGNPEEVMDFRRLVGSIPAHAGEPLPCARLRSRSGSIPAHAGEPGRRRPPSEPRKVYPRPRGGTIDVSSRPQSLDGLSPPTRGNLISMTCQAPVPRSIPAHAGEPTGRIRKACRRAVYPRPRGGTNWTSLTARRDAGLSPPTRGNPENLLSRWDDDGSIPAHAGEPKTCLPSPVADGVYPRPRGGTTTRRVAKSTIGGLSPPTRGNRRRGMRRTLCSRVYPRPRGGTSGGVSVKWSLHGLSPPTRGNHVTARRT